MEEKIDRRKVKPRCELCGELHWRFVKCDDAAVQNGREQEAAKRREQAKVHPEWVNDRDREWVTPAQRVPRTRIFQRD